MKNDSTLDYLRRLNPVPQAASVDGAELFEQITSLPQEERPTARRSPNRRRVALVAVAGAVVYVRSRSRWRLRQRRSSPPPRSRSRTGSGTSSSRP